MRNLQATVYTLLIASFFFIGCAPTEAQESNFEIAPQEFADLADKALKHVADFNWKKFYGMLSDKTELYLPDGDAGTRTAIKGKKAVMEFWDAYEGKSGNTKLIAKDFVHLPVKVKSKLAYTKITGIMVISYFSLEMHYGAEVTNVRMNWAMHFDANKKIDKIYTYYDRTPIIEAASKNFLAQGKN